MTFAAVRVDDARIPMRDGVHLAADVLRIDDATPRPVLLSRTPYSRAAARAGADSIGIARNGWVVVCQDVRGRFDSEGRFDALAQEADDGWDTVAWCTAQPWCDGRVAMWGGSYLGAAQLLCALAAPPGLAAVAPMLAPLWNGGWCIEGGAMQLGLVQPWLAGFVASEAGSSEADRANAMRVLDDPERAYREPLSDPGPRRLLDRFSSLFAAPGDDTASVDVAGNANRVVVPGFHVGGWYDAFCEDTLRAYSALRNGAATERARRGQRLVVGPWTHFSIFMRMGGEIDFGAGAAGPTFQTEMLDWTRRVLAGEDVEGDARIFVLGENRWRTMPSWPPTTTPLRLYLDSRGGANSLHGDGVLQRANGAETFADHYVHDPADPVPSRGGRVAGPHLPPPGPWDQRPVEEREDVLVYTSEPLEQALTIMGSVAASIDVVSTAESADVAVKLVDVHPDGRAFNIVDSLQRTAFTPGQPSSVAVNVGSTAIVIDAGHRLRVEVASANFPRLDRNPLLCRSTQTVLHGGDHASWIELPVLTAG